jgi:hypothetical protein
MPFYHLSPSLLSALFWASTHNHRLSGLPSDVEKKSFFLLLVVLFAMMLSSGSKPMNGREESSPGWGEEIPSIWNYQ